MPAVVAAFLLVGCSGPSPSPPAADDAPAPDVSTDRFTVSNWERLAADPDGYEGAEVEITGRVFGQVHRRPDQVAWQMWVRPQARDWNTVVLYPDTSIEIRSDDFVRVRGRVLGSFEGSDVFGAEVVAVRIEADSAEVVSALDAAPPAIRTVEPGLTVTQDGISMALEKVEFAEQETRVHLSVTNDSGASARFYSSSSRAVQGSRQADVRDVREYPQLPFEVAAGEHGSGVVVFAGMNPSVATRFFFEIHSDDHRLDLEPYRFDVR